MIDFINGILLNVSVKDVYYRYKFHRKSQVPLLHNYQNPFGFSQHGWNNRVIYCNKGKHKAYKRKSRKAQKTYEEIENCLLEGRARQETGSNQKGSPK